MLKDLDVEVYRVMRIISHSHGNVVTYAGKYFNNDS
jgi:hypothetical protein